MMLRERPIGLEPETRRTVTAREDKSNLKAGREGVRVENQAGSLEVLLRADATVTATTTMHS
jgi:hypothetical protein